MNLLRYEFIDGPDDSFNGRLQKLVKDLRYNKSMITIDEFKQAMPNLQRIEQQIQQTDKEIRQAHRNYIDEIMQELDEEMNNEISIKDDLRRASNAILISMLNQQVSFDDWEFIIGKSEHYHWLQFFGYLDKRPIDTNLLLIREVFRSICNKYDYIFINAS